MDSKEIRDLIELVSRSSFTTFELEREGFRLKLVRETEVERPAALLQPAVVGGAAPSAPAGEAAPADEGPAPADGLIELHSPIVGTFYRSPSPDAASFVDVGSRIKKGQVLCIVEAMKVMNEIESEIDAEVVEISIANGQPVEYGEVLFRLRPLN